MPTEQKTASRRWRDPPEETGPEVLDADMTAGDIIDILTRLKFHNGVVKVDHAARDYLVTSVTARRGKWQMASLEERRAIHEAAHATAAIIYNIPTIRVCIDSATPHLPCGHYRPPPGIGLEAMCILCLSGPAAEQYFCGPIKWQ